MKPGAIRHRLEGLFSLAVSLVLLYLVFVTRVITPKVLYLIPALAAVGSWLVVFGYPKRDDGLAPAWWPGARDDDGAVLRRRRPLALVVAARARGS